MRRIIILAALLLAGCAGTPVCSLDRTQAWVITTYAKTVPIASPLSDGAAICRR